MRTNTAINVGLCIALMHIGSIQSLSGILVEHVSQEQYEINQENPYLRASSELSWPIRVLISNSLPAWIRPLSHCTLNINSSHSAAATNAVPGHFRSNMPDPILVVVLGRLAVGGI